MSLIETLNGALGAADSAALTRQKPSPGLVALDHIPLGAWARLSDEAFEPNAFYHPLWARAVASNTVGHGAVEALIAWDRRGGRRMTGCLPVVSAWRALKLPLPMLVAWQAYAPLTTPLLAPDVIGEALDGLLDAAIANGARALYLPSFAEGNALTALHGVLAERGLAPQILRRYQRARLSATRDPEGWAATALGSKKRKELRRQRHRLDDDGTVTFEIASRPGTIAVALEEFLALEASGWKGRRGTALAASSGSAAFIRQAITALATESRCEIAVLRHAGAPIAAGIVLRHDHRAFFYKIAFDERSAKASPGVQLTLELTRHFCADTHLVDVDSLADADHPMIDHMWRDRLTIADVLVPLRRNDPVVAAARAALTAGGTARGWLRPVVHKLREIKAR